MKAGILTFHNADNFGCVFQCFGLQEAIRGLFPDADVEVINYERERCLGDNPKQYNEYQLKRSELFRAFRSSHMNICGEQPYNMDDLPADRYDICFVGSDQVWNYSLVAGQEKAYFLQFAGDKTIRASYAASIGSFADNESRVDWIRRNIVGMDAISIREESALGDLAKLTERDVRVCLDPTLLHDKQFWMSIEKEPSKPVKEKYVLMYALGYGWCSEYERKAADMAVAVAKEQGLKIIHYYYGKLREWFPEGADDCYCEGPQELLWLFHHAEYVICCSFHGTAFSLIYEKPFYTFYTPGNGSRMKDLVTSLGVPDRYISDVLPKDKWDWDINWNEVRKRLKEKKTQSLDYIRDVGCLSV